MTVDDTAGMVSKRIKHTHRAIQTLFGVPWLVFGVQHFLYADFVAKLVPAYFPARMFWAYFTGTAMFAAGLGLIVDVKAKLAAGLIGTMLIVFIVLIHLPKIIYDPSLVNLTRGLQDLAIASAAFMLTGAVTERDSEAGYSAHGFRLGRYIFAGLLMVFGLLHLLNQNTLPARVPPYIPFQSLFIYLTGAVMTATGLIVLLVRRSLIAPFALGVWMLVLSLLLYGNLLTTSPFNPLYWIAAMLDLAITCGVLLLANSSFSHRADLENTEV